MRIIRLAGKFLALPGKRKLLACEAVFFQYSAKFLLLILPVKKVLGLSPGKTGRRSDEQRDLPEAIRQALGYADRLSFWKNRCLVKSIAGGWMLQRRGLDSRISFGVKKSDQDKLTAHAWLMCGDFEVVAKDGDYAELSGD